ncbi:THUMP-like domain-containing protein [Arsenicicoccus dermatophilus]|uniref:THUMP-like domain-containing protein n=1 Tax=Arsenicicoccus dermatophilus TaxID=1076331 RepID=UPI0039175846
MDLETAHLLVTPEATELLRSLPGYDDRQALALATRLRAAGHSPGLTAAVLHQSALRARGRAKLGDAVDSLLLTADGLEQATRPQVARHHAQRLGSAGVTLVHDLGCGLGLDARALVEAGLVVRAIDTDPATAVLAAHNLAAVPRPGDQAPPEVACARAEDVHLTGDVAGTVRPGSRDARHTAVWLDPARRTPGVADVTGRTRRTWRLDDLAPSWELVRSLAGQVAAAGAKLSPALPHAAIPDGAEAQWVSWRGEVVECCLWWGDAVAHAGRTALVLSEGGACLLTEDDADPAWAAGDLAEWVYEPDRAVIRAGLVGALERAVAGPELDPGVGYVTSSVERDLPWARRFRVMESLPLQEKVIRAHLREIGCGAVTLKKRGVDVDPDRLRRSLRLKGSGSATLILTRHAGRPVALHVEPS